MMGGFASPDMHGVLTGKGFLGLPSADAVLRPQPAPRPNLCRLQGCADQTLESTASQLLGIMEAAVQLEMAGRGR